jgi:pimeloyl-ACP methyl ester carboxylesterase
MPAAIAVAGLMVGAVAVLAVVAGCTHDQAARGRPDGSPTARQSPSTPAASASAQPTPQPIGTLGEFHVAQRSYVFTDHDDPAIPSRILHVGVRIPVDTAAASTHNGGIFPLVVFAPGYRQCASSYSALLRQWTSAGYVVAAIDFPLTNCHTVTPDESDLTNQPSYIAFVIGRLLSLSRQHAGWLSGLINGSRIAIAGHSDGGDAVAGLAAAACCRDRALSAAIVLAGAEWPAFGSRWFAGRPPPMLFVQGTADTWNPPAASLQLYKADSAGRRYYLELPGAGHFSPYEGRGVPEPVVARVTLDFLNRYLAGQPSGLAAMRRAAQVRGVSVLVSNGRLP